MPNLSSDAIRVYLRLRPLNSLENSLGGDVCVQHSETSVTVTMSNPHEGIDNNTGTKAVDPGTSTFSFDRIFGTATTQEEVFDTVAKPVIDQVMDGFNGTLFAYGQTSSGKTHTMEGDLSSPELAGIIPRVFSRLMQLIEETQETVDFTVKVGMFEIYNEKIQDLLDPERVNLAIKEDKNKGIYVQDLLEVNVQDAMQMMGVMNQGSRNRSVAATRMNDRSSRSHSLFLLKVFQNNNQTDESKSGKLFFVDLAGSEKISKTNAQGKQLEEAKNINKSLSCLGNVIKALTNSKNTFVPYRDSKLTRILQESLGGNSKTSLILASSVCSYNDKEILSTLRFGNRAKNICNKPKQNLQLSAKQLEELVAQYQNKISQLTFQVQSLESQVKNGSEDNTRRDSREGIVKDENKKSNQKLFKQHLIIKSLTDQLQEMQAKEQRMGDTMIDQANQLEIVNNRLTTANDDWVNSIHLFSNKNLLRLKKLQWDILHMLQEQESHRRMAEEGFGDYLSFLAALEQALVDRDNLEGDLSTLPTESNSFSSNIDQIMGMATAQRIEESEEFKQLHKVIMVQQSGIQSLKALQTKLSEKIDQNKAKHQQKTLSYKEKIKKLIEFSQKSQTKQESLLRAYDEKVGEVERLEQELRQYKDIFQSKERFIEDKNERIAQLETQVQRQQSVLEEDESKKRLALFEQQFYQQQREVAALHKQAAASVQNNNDRLAELADKNKIIDSLQFQIIGLNNQMQNLKTLVKNSVPCGSSPKQVSSPPVALNRMNTGVIRQSCTNIFNSTMGFNRSGSIQAQQHRKNTIDHKVEEEEEQHFDTPYSARDASYQPSRTLDPFPQLLQKSLDHSRP